jgi:hypothetical protein
MSQRTDTNAPTTTEPAPGLRVQTASQLIATLPDMVKFVTQSPEDGQHCLDFLRRLRLGPLPEEAISFMCFALLPRPAVWWGHECLKAAPELLSDQDKAMLELVAAWVAEQDSSSRYAALNAAQEASKNDPGVWLARAAAWSGGSMSQPELPAVPVAPSLLGQVLNIAINSSLARVSQDKRRRMLDHYVNMADVLAKSE